MLLNSLYIIDEIRRSIDISAILSFIDVNFSNHLNEEQVTKLIKLINENQQDLQKKVYKLLGE